MSRRWLAAVAVAALLAACGSEDGETGEADSITIYSGRSESLVGPIIERFEQQTGIRVEARYGDTADLASTIIEEGDIAPQADVYWAQDAGALGLLSAAGRLRELPQDLLDRVPAEFRSSQGHWVGTSGRARVLVYNVEQVSEGELPGSLMDLVEDEWEGRVGWAPTNGSFQAFVTALRIAEGDETALQWLEGMRDNGTQAYENNSAIVRAVAAGEVDAGLANHYYRFQLGSEDPTVSANAQNHFFGGGDVGSLVNIAGAGILDTSDNPTGAQRFLEFLLSPAAQEVFAGDTFEYPLVEGVEPDSALPPLEDLDQPDLDLSDLADLEGTLELMRRARVL